VSASLDPGLALQELLYGLLSKTVTVYDAVPQNASFPYVTIGDDTAVDWSTKTTVGMEVTATIHSWSRYNGRKEVRETMQAVMRLLGLDHVPDPSGVFPLTFPLRFRQQVIGTYRIVQHGLEFSQVLEESDGITRHGVQRFRFRIEEV